MSENAPSHATPDAAPSEDMSWIERARRMAEYHPDALDFIRRASAHFPVAAHHVQLLLRLWVEADTLDALILPLLDEMNTELLCGQGELETTRGRLHAAVRVGRAHGRRRRRGGVRVPMVVEPRHRLCGVRHPVGQRRRNLWRAGARRRIHIRAANRLSRYHGSRAGCPCRRLCSGSYLHLSAHRAKNKVSIILQDCYSSH